MSQNAMKTPLHGVRILDLTNVLAGPFCCHQLAHMGADVIKVEMPGSGDLARQLGADAQLNDARMGVSFLAQNSGKRSMTLNLKNADGRAVFEKLVLSADVVVENFRPGVMDRLGVGADHLRALKPSLIYCAISGFGQDGPMRAQPAYDQIIQGLSGVMSITGGPDTAPYRVGYPLADTIGGMTAAFAIAAALAEPEDRRGRVIDVSMLESVIATMGWVVSNHLMADRTPAPMGNDNFTASPSGTFKTKDGLINIAANKQEQFEALCSVLNINQLITDPRFATRQARLDNRNTLTALIEQAAQTLTTTTLVAALNNAGVPAGAVASVPEALESEQIQQRDLISTFHDVEGVGRDVRLAGVGFHVDGEAPKTQTPPPQLGAHTDEILQSLGYDAEAIKSLKNNNAL